MSPSRTLAVWCPDWPVVAACAEAGVGTRAPAAVFRANLVTAGNAAARRYGIRRGMRRRDAQGRCPEVAVLPDDPDRDARAFEQVLTTIEALRPGVAAVRPGLAALPVPAAYYGGEAPAAAVLIEALVAEGVRDCRTGVADDLFTAEQAARTAPRQECVVVAPGGSPGFVGPLAVEVLEGMLEEGEETTQLVGLLRRLGVRTLADLARLPARDVHQRFGPLGARVHRLAGGTDAQLPVLREPPPDLVREVAFEPPLETVEAVCFSLRRTAEAFVEQIATRQLVCTRVRVEVECEASIGTTYAERSWAHVRWFGPGDLIDRVRWQLGAASTQGLGSPVSLVRLVPETVEPGFGEGLWGGAEELVDRQVAKVRALLGHDGVVVPVLQGGRSPADRQRLVPWGDRAPGGRDRALPWPGSIPGPAPSVVLAEPWPAVVEDAAGRVAVVSERGVMSGEPTRFRAREGEAWQTVAAWAGPWPVDELWWEPDPSHAETRRVARFQVVGADGRAWLMSCTMTSGDGRWWTEAGYE
ncbi:DNA polymerase Y family protein [Nocardioides mangrovicus]|uniref:DNA polymerase Y family protein n=1 Tax=Nocardioides mangrovicus TaxID=2478913 RepID=A0A3L8P3Y1_9ACTN|nr:DNA polymerase Y family protein [Nocardioides mangrovicus]RLV49493.1 DNA polymerase Y family protein [Nocardioides mangrovicus]